jgi:hypothetical protein
MSVQRIDEGHEGTMVVPVLQVPIDMPMVGVQTVLHGNPSGWLGDQASWIDPRFYAKDYGEIPGKPIQRIKEEMRNTIQKINDLKTQSFYFQHKEFEDAMNELFRYYFSLQNLYSDEKKEANESGFMKSWHKEQKRSGPSLPSSIPRQSSIFQRESLPASNTRAVQRQSSQQYSIQSTGSESQQSLPKEIYNRVKNGRYTKGTYLWFPYRDAAPRGFKYVNYGNSPNERILYYEYREMPWHKSFEAPPDKKKFFQGRDQSKIPSNYKRVEPDLAWTIIQKTQ